MGPTLFAYRPWLPDGSAPPSGTHLQETALLLYENAYNTSDFVRCLAGYQHPDEWEGGAWITTPSGKSAVLFAGTKSTGAKTGTATSTPRARVSLRGSGGNRLRHLSPGRRLVLPAGGLCRLL